MTVIRKEVFNDLMNEYYFLFQMETGLIMFLDPTSVNSVTRGTSKQEFSFSFTASTMSGQPLAKYIVYPNECSLAIVDDYGISENDNREIHSSFTNFFTTARLKSLFA